MEYKELESILEKYFNGDTSVEEEKLLKKYFQENKNISEKFASYRHLFGYYEDKATEKANFEINLPTKNHIINSKYIYYLVGVAASIILIFGIYFYSINTNETKVLAYLNGVPVTDEQTAINETKSALLKISSKFNDGTQELNNLTKLNKIENLLTKNN